LLPNLTGALIPCGAVSFCFFLQTRRWALNIWYLVILNKGGGSAKT